MITTTDDRRGRARVGSMRAVAALAVSLACLGCAPEPETTSPRPATASFQVTAWGSLFEVFPEIDVPVVGEEAQAYVHVTRLEGFEPPAEGSVEVRLSGPAGDQVFRADAPERPGIFRIPLRPTATGDFELSFYVVVGGDSEVIRAGRVEVGTADAPGGLRVAPAPRGATGAGEPMDFLKEEQWGSDFATAWVRTGRLAKSVVGPARLRPAAGGEAWITAPVDGVVRAAGTAPWPFPGRTVERRDPLLQVVPRVAVDRSLATLEAESTTLRTELESARARLEGLEELLSLEAVSQREIRQARVLAETLDARYAAAKKDLEAARTLRSGEDGGGALVLRSPFRGEVSRVEVEPGAGVSAGDALARIVRTDVTWIEVALTPGDARELAEGDVRGVVLEDPEQGTLRLEEGVRRVSVAPEISPETGTVAVLLEAPAVGWALGTTAEARLLSSRESEGIVVPRTALVDDGGVDVVYLQLSGESFVRQEVRVIERRGDRVLVEGLVPGQRLVTRGGDAVRRSSLMASSSAHGHVH